MVHRWVEPQCEKILEPFTVEHLSYLLTEGAKLSDYRYTHQQIADWCRRWLIEIVNERLDSPNTIYDIVQDIDAQWDLHLFNTYTYEDLIKLDLSQIRLPLEWFVNWSDRLKDCTEQTSALDSGH